MLTISPEQSGEYHCAACGNDIHFVGFDRFGSPDERCPAPGSGRQCELHASECECFETLQQEFAVARDEVGRITEIDYAAHSGGFGAEIGDYTRIVCGRCHAVVWDDGASAA